MTRIESLTAAQKAALPLYRDKWTRIGLCTEPADRKKTEEALTKAYILAGL